jgi:TatD DNase family protein
MLIDTHCHVHESGYPLDVTQTLQNAKAAGVEKLVCVGTSITSSAEAISFSETHNEAVASIGVHPHDTKDGYDIAQFVGTSEKIVAVGEIGLDYYYTHSPREVQMAALEAQIEIALSHDLPIIFHVRDAFDDFWPIFDGFEGIRGVLHSFTDSQENLDKAIERGLYIGVNGISTFTKDEAQQTMFDAVPLDKLLLETDAPFLTPHPFRGKVNQPAFVQNIAAYHAERRGITIDAVANATTANARALLRI